LDIGIVEISKGKNDESDKLKEELKPDGHDDEWRRRDAMRVLLICLFVLLCHVHLMKKINQVQRPESATIILGSCQTQVESIIHICISTISRPLVLDN
jgi:hypothetical protein